MCAENWQPIETAPKDGTAVLGFWSSSYPQVEAHQYGITRFRDGGWESADYEAEAYARPSNWRPLPSPPRQKAATEAWPCPAKDARDAALEKDRPIGSAVLAKLHAIDEEAMYEAPASCNRAISEAIDEIVLAWREKNEAATALAATQAEIARLLKAYQDTVAALDKHHGHPCEQIRHMHEVEGLKEENARKDERIAELRGALTSLLSFAKSVWFDEASCVEEEREEIDRAAAALRKDRA